MPKQKSALAGLQPEAIHIATQAAGVVMQTECASGHAPEQAALRHDEITRQHQVGSTAIDAAIERADRYRPQTFQGLGDFFKKQRRHWVVVKTVYVVARTEDGLLLRGCVSAQDHHTNVCVLVDALKMPQQRVEVLVSQTVAQRGAP